MPKIQNPILKGMNPDPSIISVGNQFYLATSTFQWLSGVRIYKSGNLSDWEMIAAPLNEKNGLDLTGLRDSAGIFAPCLSHCNGVFYLVYTVVKNIYSSFADVDNYLITTTDIQGEWSEPIYLHSHGFDPSLFHHEGKKWIVSMNWDYRKELPIDGIIMQEYSDIEKKVVGDTHIIFSGTELSFTEGPHLYYRNGYFYLMTAEGGTGYNHAVTFARSKSIFGPYEVAPNSPILTSKDDDCLLQKAGHGCLFSDSLGNYYLSHLASRAVSKDVKRCILGRETCIQNVIWTSDDWLTLEDYSNTPKDCFLSPFSPDKEKAKAKNKRYTFENGKLDSDFSFLRQQKHKDWLSFCKERSTLCLKGGDSLSSLYRQSLVAIRQTEFSFEATIKMYFSPNNYKQMSGLIYYYDTNNYFYQFVSKDEDYYLQTLTCIKGEMKFSEAIKIPENKAMLMKLTVEDLKARFSYSFDDELWEKSQECFDATMLSDEEANVDGFDGFTGAFIGICVQDMADKTAVAEFEYLRYCGKDLL